MLVFPTKDSRDLSGVGHILLRWDGKIYSYDIWIWIFDCDFIIEVLDCEFLVISDYSGFIVNLEVAGIHFPSITVDDIRKVNSIIVNSIMGLSIFS